MPAITRSRPGNVVGALGDLGTLVPVAAGLVIGIDAGRFFVAFGLGTIAAGVLFGPPMPLQPQKASPQRPSQRAGAPAGSTGE
jgi:hypothetical protein